MDRANSRKGTAQGISALVSASLEKGPFTVRELYEFVRTQHPSITRSEMVSVIIGIVERGDASLEEVPSIVGSFFQYLAAWDMNLWLYVSFTVTIGTILAVLLIPSDSLLLIGRWILGSIFVVLFPGYVAVQALFPIGNEFRSFERFVLSIGLSLVILMLTGMFLSYASLGIRLVPIVTSLVLLTLTLSLIAAFRKYRNLKE